MKNSAFRRRLAFFAFLFFIFGFTSAQSFFSSRGLGEEVLFNDARMRGVGGALALSYENPSYPLSLTKTRFNATINSNFLLGQEAAKTRFLVRAKPQYLKGIVPLPKNLRLRLGMSQKYDQEFDVYSDSFGFYRRHIKGSGGIYNFSLGVSSAPLTSDKWQLAIGLDYHYSLGRAQEDWLFEVFPGNYLSIDTIKTHYSGQGLNFGFNSRLRFFDLGFFYELPFPYYAKSQIRSHSQITDSANLRIELPQGFGLGIKAPIGEKLSFYLDLFFKNYKKTTISDSIWTILRMTKKYSIGVEYFLTERHPLRFGFRHYDWNLLAQNNSPILENALTLGSSVPISKFGSWDFSLELIRRRGGELTELVGRFTMTLSFEEKWEKRKRRWGY